MLFKTLFLQVGDIVTINASSIPSTDTRAAVVDVKDGVLQVFSPSLAPFHTGNLTAEDVTAIKVVKSAQEAIQEQTNGKFKHGQLVKTDTFDSKDRPVQAIGNVVAAFGGFIVIKDSAGELITGLIGVTQPVTLN